MKGNVYVVYSGPLLEAAVHRVGNVLMEAFIQMLKFIIYAVEQSY